jgi:hypothetical protein
MTWSDRNERIRASDPDLAALSPGEVRRWDWPAGLPYGYCGDCGALVDVLYEKSGAFQCAICANRGNA